MNAEHVMAPGPAVLRPLVRKEQRHRRMVLLALAVLIVLSISPVIGHHLIGGVPWLPASLERVGIFCVGAVHQALAPVHTLSHAMLVVGLAWATFDRARAARSHRRVMGALVSRPPVPESPVARAALVVGVPADRVRVVEMLPNPAFTSGWWTPLVFVAADLAGRLTPPELEAVMAHEGAHLARRDPLRLFALRYLSSVLFWLPALRRLTEDWADEAEIAADDVAARTHAFALASAILAMAGGHDDHEFLEPAVGFQRADLLERRIRRLAGEDAQVGTHVSWGALAGAAAALALVWSAGLIVLHPLPRTVDGQPVPVRCAAAHETVMRLPMRHRPALLAS